MFKWKKLGRIFNPTEIKNQSWMKEFAQAPSVLIFDKYRQSLFFLQTLPDEKGQYVSRLGLC